MAQLGATVTIVQLPAGTTVTGTELIEAVQTASGQANSVQLSLNQAIAGLNISGKVTASTGISIAGSTTLAVALATASGLSVLGVAGVATTNPAPIVGTADQALVVNHGGTGLAFGPVNLATSAAVTGVLPVPNGGHGTSTLTAFGVVFGSGTSTVGITAAGTANLPLIANGSALAPAFAALNLSLGSAAVTGLLPFASIATVAGLSVAGVAGTAAASLAAITGATSQVLAVSSNGTTLAFTGAPVLATSLTVPFINITTPAAGVQFNGTTVFGSVVGTAYVGFFNADSVQVFLAGNSADKTNYYSNDAHVFRTSNATTIIGAFRGGLNIGTTGDPGAGNISAAGVMTIKAASAVPAGGTTGAGYLMSSVANFGMFFGSGVPSLSAGTGSVYLRSDGATATTRMYVNINGTGGWTGVTTVA